MNIRIERNKLAKASKKLSILSFSDKVSRKQLAKDKERSLNTQKQHCDMYKKYKFYDNFIKACDNIG